MLGTHTGINFICAAAGVVCALAVQSVAAPNVIGAELLFYASFDQSAIPERAAGRTAPAAEKHLEFAPGVRGRALKMTAESAGVLAYDLPGNLDLERGTVMFWYRPTWGEAKTRIPVRPLFSTDRPGRRPGDGSIALFAWSTCVRGDLSTLPDRKKGLNKLENGRWSHIAFTWEGAKSTLYVDGEAAGLGPAHSAQGLILKPGRIFKHPALPEEHAKIRRFYVGGEPKKRRAPADGLIDELKIFSAPLDAAAIAREAAAVNPFYATRTVRRYVLAETVGESPLYEVVNSGTAPREFTWVCLDAAGNAVAEAKTPVGLAPGKKLRLAPKFVTGAAAGSGQLIITGVDGCELTRREFVAITKRDLLVSPQKELKATPLFTLRPHEMTGNSDIFTAIGSCRTGELEGRKYLETGSARCDRFAVRLKFPEAGKLYLVEIDYPDDRKRTADIVFQPAGSSAPAFELQVGYFTGGDDQLTHKMLTSSRLYFAPSADIAVIAMGARAGMPAAIAEIRVSRVEGGLPEPGIVPAPPVDGMTRTVGMNFEDPSIGSDFGVDPLSPAGGVRLADRLAAYLCYSGQNALVYPVVFYGAPLNDEYTGRAHAPGFAQLWCKRFATLNLDFYPAFNMYSLPGAEVSPPASALKSGAYNASEFSILSSGVPSTSGLHRDPPLFNFMHPAVRNYVRSCLDRVLDEIGDSPAFRGVVFNISPRSFLSFGKLEAGYNDYTVAAFERDSDLKVPVDRNNPERGRLYAQWLLENARERWIAWRCAALTAFYRETVEYLRSRRPDLVLVVNPRFSYLRFLGNPETARPNYQYNVLREAGFDPALMAKVPGLVFMHTTFPAGSRHREGIDSQDRIEAARRLESGADYFKIIAEASFPFVHQHDVYWESRVGGGHKAKMDSREKDKPNPLSSDWLRETIWRVGVINPGGRAALRPYVLPLRYSDLCGMTRGGFLIGTYGCEVELREFARVFRALPASKFETETAVSGATVVVRRLKLDGVEWRYAVNTGKDAAEISLVFEPGTVTVPERKAVSAGAVKFHLKPYEIIAFRRSPGQIK